MKYLLTALTTIMVFGLLALSAPVLAQTPDGQTPAQETVCDALQEDGITKGLYGLCVAFCEAGDYADELDTITPEELAALETSSPSGRILANYNKKKDRADNPNDPDMPCILVEEPCPCWTADELASTGDGIHNISGTQPDRVGCYSSGQILTGGSGTLNIFDFSNPYPYNNGRLEQMVVWESGRLNACRMQIIDPDTPSLFSQLSVEAGTLTEEQHDACVAQAVAHWESQQTGYTEGNCP